NTNCLHSMSTKEFNTMKSLRFGFYKPAVSTVVLVVLMLSGCSSPRSISDSAYRDETRNQAQAPANPFYKGELSEFEVLGISPETKITEEEINKAFEVRQRFILTKGSSIMLVQSGAMIPDEPMVKALEKYYNVSVFSGIPMDHGANDYAMSLRLAAAKGGYGRIVAYWGLLETAQKNLGTKAVSWVPFIGGAIPDEGQEMRIRLKVAVVDVMSGQWDMFSPEPFQDSALSAHYTRESSDQGQVASLKTKAYEGAAEDLVKRYSK
ncbi:MAG: hypothetical protein AB2L11_10125, partial [Syntrophobacteraceae bacterium]